MFNELSINTRMLVACSVVVLLFSSTFIAVGLSLTDLTQQIEHEQHLVGSAAARNLTIDEERVAVTSDIPAAMRSITDLMVVGGAVSAIMAAIFGVWIVTGLRRQLGGDPAYVAALVSKIAQGDLTVKPGIRAGDNTSLIFSIRNMVESLIRINLQVRNNSNQVNTLSASIASGNTEIARRIEEQSMILIDTGKSVAEMRSAVLKNMENARLGHQLASGANDIAEQSGKAVEMLVATMSGIHASSKRIEDILGVIDGIAFQTNILALNAAVEAARAGEQGRGFAVVAGEVRNLAQRSATASKEIKALIGESVQRVDDGSREVSAAAEGISDVVTSVHLVAAKMKEISDATAGQSDSIEAVAQHMAQMDSVTKRNVTLIEQATIAADAMRTQAKALVESVSMFMLDENEARRPVVPQRQAAGISVQGAI